jgi:hypothetical protein
MWLITGIATVVYMVPTIIAVVRRVPYLGYLVFRNVCGGWTLFGYVTALFWATSRPSRRQEAGWFP